jgi:hypothetical protein
MSKFTSFLKKAGQILSTVAQDASIVLPALAPFVNLVVPASKQTAVQGVETTVESDLNLLNQSVMTAETTANTLAAGGTTLSGAQKAAIAAPAILQVFLNSEAMAGKKIANPAAAQAAAATIAGGIADFWNAVDGSALPNPPVGTSTTASPEVIAGGPPAAS